MPNEIWETVYFEKSGSANTDKTLELAKKRAVKLGIRNIVVASRTGSTGVKASEIFKDFNLVVVTFVTGFEEPNIQSFLPENRDLIARSGANILTATHAFGALGRAVRKKFNAIQVDEIIANVLRLFGQGVKVACEVACMAADAGLIRTDEDAVAIGGSGYGSDVAIIVRPSNTHTFFEMKIKEIVCKPRL